MVRKLVDYIFYLGIKNKLMRRVIDVISLLVFFYILLYFWPYPTFAHSISYKQFKVYSDNDINSGLLNPIIDRAVNLASKSDVYDSTITVKLLLPESKLKYGILTLMYFRSIGFTNPFTKNVIISLSDLSSNKAYIDKFRSNFRNLDELIAHELCHIYQYKVLGYYKFVTLPIWIKEGYPEFISNPHVIGGFSIVNLDTTNLTKCDRDYIRYRQKVESVMLKQPLGFRELSKYEE